MAIPFRQKKRTEDGNIFGKLGAVALTDILHMLGVNQRTATVYLSKEGKTGEIFFRQGVLLHASVGSTRGDEALMRLVDWKDADFVVEEGIPEETPSTISRSVDAVLLDVMTRLDEGFVPNVTPFPGIDRPTIEEIKSAARMSRMKPPPPRRRLGLVRPILAAAAIASCAAAYLFVSWTRLGDIPSMALPVEEESAIEPDTPSGIADLTLRASIEGTALDTWGRLQSEGLTLPSSPQPSEPVAAPSVPAATEIATSAPVQKTGYLLVVAEPWAEVQVDGQDVGETPLAELELSAGVHEIGLRNPNVIGVIRDRVEVRAGETLRRSYSFGITGRLRIVVRPWADVYVDGRSIGQTPLDELQVTPGPHTIVLRHPTLGEKTRVIEVRREETALVEVEM